MSGGGGSQTTTTVQELAPEQRQLLELVIPEAKNIAANPPSLFPGSTVAPFTPLQQAAQKEAVDTSYNTIAPLTKSTVGAHQTLQGATIPAATQGVQGLVQGVGMAQPAQNFMLSGAALSPQSNPYLADTARAAIAPVAESLTEQVLPSIRTSSDLSGQFGGSRQGIAEGRAISDFLRQAGDISSGIYSRGYDTGFQGMSTALGHTLDAAASGTSGALEAGSRSLFAAPTVADLALTPTKVLSSVGQQQQFQNQQLLNEQAQRYMTDQIMPFLVAQEVANLAFGVPGGSVTARSTGGGGGGGALSTGLGLLGLGVGSFFGMPHVGMAAGSGLGGLLGLL